MMGGQDLEDAARHLRKCAPNLCDLLARDSPARMGEPARRIEAQHRDLIVDEKITGQSERRDVATILRERREKALEQIVERDVVIAGHYQLGLRDLIEQMPRRHELTLARTLREIAADHD